MTLNPEIRNAPVRVLLNIWRLEQARVTKFDMNVSNKIILNAAKCQDYSLYCFCAIKGKPREVPPRSTSPPPRLGLTFVLFLVCSINHICFYCTYHLFLSFLILIPIPPVQLKCKCSVFGKYPSESPGISNCNLLGLIVVAESLSSFIFRWNGSSVNHLKFYLFFISINMKLLIKFMFAISSFCK